MSVHRPDTLPRPRCKFKTPRRFKAAEEALAAAAKVPEGRAYPPSPDRSRPPQRLSSPAGRQDAPQPRAAEISPREASEARARVEARRAQESEAAEAWRNSGTVEISELDDEVTDLLCPNASVSDRR